jgi:hypothetical protein
LARPISSNFSLPNCYSASGIAHDLERVPDRAIDRRDTEASTKVAGRTLALRHARRKSQTGGTGTRHRCRHQLLDGPSCAVCCGGPERRYAPVDLSRMDCVGRPPVGLGAIGSPHFEMRPSSRSHRKRGVCSLTRHRDHTSRSRKPCRTGNCCLECKRGDRANPFDEATKGGEITVAYNVSGTDWQLTVADNGSGKP